MGITQHIHFADLFQFVDGQERFIVTMDNGSQLVAASKELVKDWKVLWEFGVTHGSDSKWSFSAAEAPWMNGATET